MIFEKENFTILLLEGDTSIDSIIDIVRKFGLATAEGVIIYRNITSFDSPTEKVRQLSALMGDKINNLEKFRTGVVVEDDLEFGLTRMFQSFSEMNGNSNQIGIFKTIQDCSVWLNKDVSNFLENSEPDFRFEFWFKVELFRRRRMMSVLASTN